MAMADTVTDALLTMLADEIEAALEGVAAAEAVSRAEIIQTHCENAAAVARALGLVATARRRPS